MVQIQRNSRTTKGTKDARYFIFILVVFVGTLLLFHLFTGTSFSSKTASITTQRNVTCGQYSSLSDLTQEERYPVAGSRHMVDPPKDGTVTLVCCHTTVGTLTVAVHSAWAPIGAAHFLTLVREGYFSSRVALMRCLKGFLCQFGIAGTAEFNQKYHGQQLVDDVNWLPEGPDHRTNERGVKRFARGYLAYAGGGKNTRSNQFIISLTDQERLAGGSPWEVPWGELVGLDSFVTLGKIYTGYGEDGPPQGLLSREGSSENIKEKWPLLDYITSCHIIDELEMPPR